MIKFDIGISQRRRCHFDDDDLFYITLHKNYELSKEFYCCTNCMTLYDSFGIGPRRLDKQGYKIIINFYLECLKHFTNLKENTI